MKTPTATSTLIGDDIFVLVFPSAVVSFDVEYWRKILLPGLFGQKSMQSFNYVVSSGHMLISKKDKDTHLGPKGAPSRR